MTTFDEQKRAILPYLQRAAEIEKHDPKVAYYCRLYAVEQGLAIPKRDPQINGLLQTLLAKLEKDKLGAGLSQPLEDRAYLEDFALKVFTRADKVDRAGLADKKTAVTFLAASYFIEVLNQFGEVAPDLQEKQRYAIWKAADINKALREGRQPTPGPAGGGPTQQESNGSQGDGAWPSPPGTESGSLPSPSAPSAPFTPPPLAPIAPPPAPAPLPPAPIPDDPAHITSVSLGGAPWGPLPGSKVLYCEQEGAPVVPGTVARLETSEGGPLYDVALPDRFVKAGLTQLALELQAGDKALYSKDGSCLEVAVVAADRGHWPPTYVVQLPEGGERDVSSGQLSPVPPGGRAPSFIAGPPPPAPVQPDASSISGYPTLGAPPAPPSAPPPAVPSLQPGAPPAPSSLQRAAPPAAASQPAAPVHGGGGGAAQPAPMPKVHAATAHVYVPAAVPGFQPSLSAITEAQKSAKYAVSSLAFEDVATAVKHLTDALRTLTQPHN